MSWDERCLESIRKDKKEIEARYGIRIGQTEVYCARCGKPWGFGRHSCQDMRLEKLKEAKKVKRGVLGAILRGKKDVPLSQDRVYGLNACSVSREGLQRVLRGI